MYLGPDLGSKVVLLRDEGDHIAAVVIFHTVLNMSIGLT